MKRSTFKRIIAVVTATLFMPMSFLQACRRAMAAATLVSEFLNPPQSAKTSTRRHWINGNIVSGGITDDLEFLRKAGTGDFRLFRRTPGRGELGTFMVLTINS